MSRYETERDPVRVAGRWLRWGIRWIAAPAIIGLIISANVDLRSLPFIGSKAALPERSRANQVDVAIREGEPLEIGRLRLHPLYTPGHTDDHHAYLLRSRDSLRNREAR